MRVISGSARGCRLFSLEGDNTRPTTDRVKEALFSIIQFNIYGSTVLDLFSGSGALGIEALSRGAAFCDFVEQQKDAAEIIAKNLEKTHLGKDSCLNITTAQQFLSNCQKQYDIIFLDPPYNNGLCVWAVKEICKNNLICDNGIFVCETSAEETLPFPGGKRKTYGKIAITVFKKEEVVW